MSRRTVIKVDDQYFPVILHRWRAPYPTADVDAYFAVQRRLSERARAESTWLVTITVEGDALSIAERKYVAECTKAMPKPLRDRAVASFAVLTNPVTRGVLTAMKWLIDEFARVEAVPTDAAALELARATLAERGVALPPQLDLAALRAAVAKLELE
jgi:hypothetical protein